MDIYNKENCNYTNICWYVKRICLFVCNCEFYILIKDAHLHTKNILQNWFKGIKWKTESQTFL